MEVSARDFPDAADAAEAAWLSLRQQAGAGQVFSVRNPVSGQRAWVSVGHRETCDPTTAGASALDAATGELLSEAWHHREVCEITAELVGNITHDVTAGLAELGIDCEAPTVANMSSGGLLDPQLRYRLALAQLALEDAQHAAANLQWEQIRLAVGANLHQLTREHPDKAPALRELCASLGCYWPR